MSDDDLRMLDDYRGSFELPYRNVVSVCRDSLRLTVSGRPSKSTIAIIDKLRRESVRLSQIQDIAGCRIVVESADRQDRVVEALKVFVANHRVIDRNRSPSHGYRAVHVVAIVDGLPVEIQVRTAFQHQWAELSEKFSDISGAEVKYGLGDPPIRALLLRLSEVIMDFEENERARAKALVALAGRSLKHQPKLKRDVRDSERHYRESRARIEAALASIVSIPRVD